ncbi:MAG TPA: chromosomal replication initiator protein DnaA [Anaerolineae bacterium]|nr:chromosomal replication initiator protein DnaA [Anaerolineae bacterium]
MKSDQIWQAALGELQLQMTKATFDTWVKPTSVISYEDGSFVVGVPNAYAQDWLQTRLLSTIKRILTGIAGQSVEVKFIVWIKEETAETVPLLEGLEAEPPISIMASRSNGNYGNGRSIGGLNPRYVFDTFVVGPSNRLAHAACVAVAERPAAQYNPLFLYGGVGLGKTHLLHAIGHEGVAKNLQVLYVSSEEFTNDMINAIRTQNQAAFRDKYRTIDVLLIDDIQFIAGKESTQEEFFHTFNTLHGNGKQIVMTSDRPPKSMITLEERLRSRFEWGLIADIQQPDLETRTAILRDKAEHLAAAVPSDVIDFIARQVQSNIRELEGALNRVVAYARLRGNPLTVEIASAALADLMSRPSTVTIDEILSTVANYYSISMDDLLGRGRNRELVHPRQVAMYLAREELQVTLPQIGEALGGRDHTTVMYGVEKVTQAIDSDDAVRREILALRERLYNRNTVLDRT